MDNKSQTLGFDDSTQEAIRSQLSHILLSSFFSGSPQASRFLNFVVEAVLSGQSYNIKQYSIAVDAFGYPTDFDPQVNPAMRILAGRLRMMLDRYYMHEGKNDDIKIDVLVKSKIGINS
jgi:hypothetical protein